MPAPTGQAAPGRTAYDDGAATRRMPTRVEALALDDGVGRMGGAQHHLADRRPVDPLDDRGHGGPDAVHGIGRGGDLL